MHGMGGRGENANAWTNAQPPAPGARRPRSKADARSRGQVGEKLVVRADADRVGRAARGSGTETAARARVATAVTPCPALAPARARSPRVVASRSRAERSGAGRHTISGPASLSVAFPSALLLRARCRIERAEHGLWRWRWRDRPSRPTRILACTRRCAPPTLSSI